MSKHINGPWSVHLCDETLVADSDGEPVAQVEGHYRTESEKMEARARLIAAAPDYHDAASPIVDCINQLGDGVDDGEMVAVSVGEIRALRAAHRKATGAA